MTSRIISAAQRLTPILLLSLILGVGWFLPSPTIPGYPGCFFQKLTHFDCPGCGLTRAFFFLSRGDVAKAIHYNAAAPFIYLLFATYFFENAVKLLKSDFRLHIPGSVSKVYSVITVAVLASHWIYKIAYQAISN